MRLYNSFLNPNNFYKLEQANWLAVKKCQLKTSYNKSRIELVIIGIISFLLVVIINSFINTTRNNNKKDELLAPFLNHQSTWVDSLMNNMTLDEKIGNLLIYVTQDINNEQDLTQLLELLSDLKVGGVSITTDSLLRYIELYNLLQSKCNIPILFSNTSENGAVNLYNENN